MVRNVELKLLCSTISKLWGWQNSKAWQFPLCWIACGEAGFDSTGGNVKWYNTYGEEFEDILSNYIIFVPQSNSPTSRNSTWRYKLKKHKNAVIICIWIKWITEALFVVANTGNLPKHF